MPPEQLTLDSISDDDIDYSTDMSGSDGGALAAPPPAGPQAPVDAPPNPAGSPAEPGAEAVASTAPDNIPAAGAPGAAPSGDPEPWYAAIGREHGLQLGADEAAARQNFGTLLGRMRQMAQSHAEMQELAELGRRYQYEQYQRQQQQPVQAPAAPAAPAEPPLPWTPVKLSAVAEAWLNPITRAPREDAPQAVKDEFVQWAVSQRKVLETLHERPQELINPLVQQTLSPLETRIQQLEQQLAMQPIQHQAQQFAQANAAWMMAPDPLTGRYTYTPAGQRFMHYAQQAQQFTADPQAVQDYSMNMLQRDLHAAAMQQLEQQLIQAGITPITRAQAAAAPPQASPAQPPLSIPNRAAQLPAGAGQVPSGGGTVNGHARKTPGANRVNQFIEELMARNGISDEMIDFTR